ncbi:MAG: hypothetical protein JSU86_19240 [Phycisphaerales bacterium]|nr:MAG: hypothetical protein JSU86_19240 [Phycisphaerales bacterium]
MAGAIGCGSSLSDALSGRSLFLAECDGNADRVAADLVVLDWQGGVTAIYPDEDFEALDLSAFETPDGGTLADDAEQFKELVRLQATRIFCDSSGPGICIRHADDVKGRAGTTVYYTQALSPVGWLQIGEGEYDVCNRQHDNAAVIFGERVLRLGAAYTFDEWVLVFANLTAHEIAHTLGYAHVSRDESPEAERSYFVELMYDGHTMEEMRREQRFLVDQTNCPADSPANLRRVEYPTITCGVVDHPAND